MSRQKNQSTDGTGTAVTVGDLTDQAPGDSSRPAADPVDLPGTAAFLDRVIALPCGHWLDATALDSVATALTQALLETQR